MELEIRKIKPEKVEIKMKMSNEFYTHILSVLKENEQSIREYAPALKEHGKYQNFETRLSFDCFNKLVRGNANSKYWDKTTEFTRNEDLNDNHLETGIKKALRELGIL